MEDIECPYCEKLQEIDNEDGFEEDTIYEQECENCNKTFIYTTTISYSYKTEKADCLNGAPHDFKPTTTVPKEYTMMRCVTCWEKRKPTEEEMKSILSNEK